MTCVLFFQNLQWIEFKGSNDDLMIDEKINKSMGSPTELITKKYCQLLNAMDNQFNID